MNHFLTRRTPRIANPSWSGPDFGVYATRSKSRLSLLRQSSARQFHAILWIRGTQAENRGSSEAYGYWQPGEVHEKWLTRTGLLLWVS